jgi:hypothetical protein
MDSNLENHSSDESIADVLGAEPTEADSIAAARHEANLQRLEHDIDLLETEAKHLGKSLARQLGPPAAAVVVLSVVAFIAGRRLRNRAARRKGRKSKAVYRL